jgi:beta-glucosidase
VEAGETQKVRITIPNRNLSFVDEAGARRISTETVQVWAGGGQPVSRTGLRQSAGVSGSFKISGSATLPK